VINTVCLSISIEKRQDKEEGKNKQTNKKKHQQKPEERILSVSEQVWIFPGVSYSSVKVTFPKDNQNKQFVEPSPLWHYAAGLMFGHIWTQLKKRLMNEIHNLMQPLLDITFI